MGEGREVGEVKKKRRVKVKKKGRVAEAGRVTAVSPSDGEGKRIVVVEKVAVGEEIEVSRLYPDGTTRKIGRGVVIP